MISVTSEKLPQTQIRLRIEVPHDDVTPFLEKAARRLSEKVSIKGFRPGKVPIEILKQQLGELAIYEEAMNDIVDTTYVKAIEQEQLRVASRANIEIEKLAPKNPVIYTATVALLPHVQLGNYNSLKTKKNDVVIDEKKFDNTKQQLREMQAQEKLVLREARDGDKVIVDFTISIGDVPIEGGSATKQSVLLGKHELIPGFEEQIFGMHGNEEKKFDITFPENYGHKQYSSKGATVQLKIHDVYERTLPEWNDAFAQGLRFDSIGELEKNIRDNTLKEQTDAEQRRWENAVVMEIVEKSTIEELPPQLVGDEITKMIHELKTDIGRQNIKFEDYLAHMKKTEEELRDHFRDAAQQRIRAALVLRELAVAEKITVPAEDVEKELEQWKTFMRQVPAMEKNDDENVRHALENMLIHRKTMERIAQISSS